MIKVVFVGDSPSKTNVDDNIAFVGSKCFIKVVDWIKNEIQPDYYICLNSDRSTFFDSIHGLERAGFSVVALGNRASKRLTTWGIEHFKLPHPSGLNRKLNNKAFTRNELLKAHYYVRGVSE